MFKIRNIRNQNGKTPRLLTEEKGGGVDIKHLKRQEPHRAIFLLFETSFFRDLNLGTTVKHRDTHCKNSSTPMLKE